MKLALTTLLAVVTLADVAHARDYEHSVRLGLKGAFGFGGEGTSELDGYGGELEDDLEPTLGFALFAHLPLHRYFHIGLQTMLSWTINETAENYGADRTFVMDISPVLKARVPLLDDKLELYLLVPIGISIVVPGEDAYSGIGEVDTGIGWNAGVQLGVSYLFYEGLAALVELGWQGRGASNDTQVGAELETGMNQFALHFGLSYAF